MKRCLPKMQWYSASTHLCSMKPEKRREKHYLGLCSQNHRKFMLGEDTRYCKWSYLCKLQRLPRFLCWRLQSLAARAFLPHAHIIRQRQVLGLPYLLMIQIRLLSCSIMFDWRRLCFYARNRQLHHNSAGKVNSLVKICKMLPSTASNIVNNFAQRFKRGEQHLHLIIWEQ